MALMWLVFTIITILTGVFTHTGSKSARYVEIRPCSHAYLRAELIGKRCETSASMVKQKSFSNARTNLSGSYASVAFIYLFSGVHNLGYALPNLTFTPLRRFNRPLRWTGAMMLYVVEILPYSMRAKGISLFWLITGLAGAFNTYVNPIGLKAFGKDN